MHNILFETLSLTKKKESSHLYILTGKSLDH